MTTPNQLATVSLHEQMAAQLEVVNHGVTTFADSLSTEVATEHPDVAASVDSYLSLLERGGKRTRGILTVMGYNMYGGQDQEVAATAAGTVEAMHAYLLVMDDVTDMSDLRRGGPTAHIQMRNYFAASNAQGDTAKLGIDTAQTAALYAQHKAQSALLEVKAPAEQRLLAAKVLNDGLARTGLGQALDILAPACEEFSNDDILKVASYKTAYYSFLLPLQVGAALAGAPEEELSRFTEYSLAAGMAFQLRDDVVGVFGDEAVTGKPRMSDVIEGKKTLLMGRALELATDGQREILLSALGNTELTDEHFDQCLDIIRSTGALDDIDRLIDAYAEQACASLDKMPPELDPAHLDFLRSMAMYGARRNA